MIMAESSIPSNVCPQCSSEVRYFFVHFDKKVLMCENLICDFPFGYKDLEFVTIDNDEEISDVSIRTGPFSPTSSAVSTSGWSEIDKINRAYESEDSQVEPHSSNIFTKNKKKNTVSNKNSQKIIQKNVEDLKGLSMQLMEIDTKQPKMIKNEKWIKNLMTLQGQSGLKLLQPQELENLKNDKNENKRELKIDIGPGDKNSLSSIKIEISNQNMK